MLDVHPPHHAANTWKDFFIHIATIVVGLLIAIGLETTVEMLHHRHTVREVREKIREEVKENQELLAEDLRYLDSNRDTLRQNISLLKQYQKDSKQLPAPEIHSPWHWSSPSSAAWETTKNTGALAWMSYEDAHAFTLVYSQQNYVNEQAALYINHHHAATTPLSINPDISALTPTQIDELIHGFATTVSDIQYLEELMKGLDGNYTSMLREM
jgi:hypothetical protein